MYLTCISNAVVSIYNISNNLITLENNWASGVSGGVGGIAFFPSDAQNHALLAVSNTSVVIIQVTSPTVITSVYTFAIAHDFRQIAISPSGNKALAVTYNSYYIDYFN